MRVLVAAAALAQGQAIVEGDDHHYLFRVRRLAPGARLVVFDGEGGEADATVESVSATQAVLRLGAARREAPAVPRLTVVQALIKGERMEWCVQKLVEVGVDRVVLVASERAVVKLDAARAASRIERLAAIAREAAKQCRRAVVPPVELLPWREALTLEAVQRIVCHPVAARPLRELVAAAPASVVAIVGPEGGLAPREIDEAAAAGFEAVSLGTPVLRAETAGAVVVGAYRVMAV